MAFLIGVDEAGYGPNLGPLVIASSVWELPDSLQHADLYEQLAEVVSSNAPTEDDRWWVADSKRVYQAGSGLGALEHHMLVGALLSGLTCGTWRELWRVLAASPCDALDGVPWHHGRDMELPRSASWPKIHGLVEKVSCRLRELSIRLVGIRALAVFPSRFNELVESCGNKSTLLSQLSLALVGEVLEQLAPHSSVVVHCDKHGGRNRYGSLLQTAFPEYLIEVYDECATESVYRWGPRERRIECRFCAGGERFLPSALASMTAKYLRELAMEVFNEFWCSRLPAIEPTAGYPVDAKRFRGEIQALQKELGISDAALWRCR